MSNREGAIPGAFLNISLAFLLSAVGPVLAEAQQGQDAARDSVLREFAADVASLQRRLELASSGGYRTEVMYAPPDSVVVTDGETGLRAEPRDDARTIRRVREGTVLRVLSTKGDWFEVLLKPPAEGESTGWVSVDSAIRLARYGFMGAVDLRLDIWEAVVRRAADLRQKYAENPYVRVTGFDMEVGVPPSLSVVFEFK